MRKTFGPKEEELIGDWRKLHNEDLHDSCSPDIVRLIKSTRRRWAGMWHVWRRKEIERVSGGKTEVKKNTWKNYA